jgi:hypothetical protein
LDQVVYPFMGFTPEERGPDRDKPEVLEGRIAVAMPKAEPELATVVVRAAKEAILYGVRGPEPGNNACDDALSVAGEHRVIAPVQFRHGLHYDVKDQPRLEVAKSDIHKGTGTLLVLSRVDSFREGDSQLVGAQLFKVEQVIGFLVWNF